ncbi:hypothetical protein Bca4012_020165 [Brassica carinata]
MISPSSSDDQATVLANLNTKVFPSILASLLEGDPPVVIQSLQGDLFQMMSQLFHLGERMNEQASDKAELDVVVSQPREEKNILTHLHIYI